MRTYVGSKVHNVQVTDKSVHYHGSVGIGSDLMDSAGIEDHEQVHIINLSNGNRWVTYAIRISDGQFSLNGGGARLGELGDRCVILTYVSGDRFDGARVIYCGPDPKFGNVIVDRLTYGDP